MRARGPRRRGRAVVCRPPSGPPPPLPRRLCPTGLLRGGTDPRSAPVALSRHALRRRSGGGGARVGGNLRVRRLGDGIGGVFPGGGGWARPRAPPPPGRGGGAP